MTNRLLGQILTASVLLAGGPVLPGARAAGPAEGVYARVLPATALVQVNQERGLLQGTAFLLDREERLLVTSWHFVEGNDEVRVQFPRYDRGELCTEPSPYHRRLFRGEALRARVVLGDPSRDLAVLQLDALPDASVLPLARAAPRPGAPLYFIGNPPARNVMWDRRLGHYRATGERRFTYELGQDVAVRVLEMEVPGSLESGYSGGPVVNAEGEVVGMIIASPAPKSATIYCVEAAVLRDVLLEARVRLALKALLRQAAELIFSRLF